ncbi:MAG TPA: TetR family transcriptional regulator [Acidimicrobiales bacterium]|nr:TetR family transcriptional regulator [Acidimicrobiales bacterium]
MGLRERNRSRTETEIAEAAVRLFTTRGFEATTVADIADAADVSERTFFRYFRTKEDVVFAGHERYLASLCEAVTEAAGEGDDRRVLATVIRRFARYLQRHPEVTDRLRLCTTDERLFERVLAIRATWERSLADALASAKGKEEASLDERILASSLVGALQVALQLWVAEGHGDLDRLVRRALDHALVAAPGR